MGKTGPKTPEGIMKVTQNLPEGNGGDAWGFTEKGKKAMAIANHLNNLKHGLYATIPIRCKGKNCPYAKSCYIQQQNMAPIGEVCPIEASTIEQLVTRYAQELDVDPKKDMVKISLIRELVDIEISILRCDKKLASDPDVVKNYVIAVTEDGSPVTQPMVNKAYELQEKLIRQRQKTLSLLNSTPKDKAQNNNIDNLDPSSIFGEMKKRLEELKNNNGTIDITPETKEGESI